MSDRISCILIEDETPAIEIFTSFIEKFQNLELIDSFTDILSAREFLKSNQVNVIFLDIQLPGMTGMEFLEMSRPDSLIVICSAYEEHAIKAFEREVFDYLLKPYSLVRFTKTIERIEKYFQNSQDANPIVAKEILVKSGIQKIKVELRTIVFIESENEYVHFHLKGDKKIMSRMSMSEVVELLGTEDFLQIHRSYIVNKKMISSMATDYVKIEDHKIPIGRTFKQVVQNKLL